ncbi:MAG: type II toxin-antitoxin system PemK/MazF family toxin [Patescibacteria group bacterium]
MVKQYIPDRGDICWASLDPTLGHEQSGRRPVLVLSLKKYNGLSGLTLVCPLTSQIKPYPYVVLLGNKGAILVDQIKSVSWEKRNFTFITTASPEIISAVLQKLKILLDI